MAKDLDIQGICCTCNHRNACLSLRNSLKRGKPILYCEDFDCFEDTTVKNRNRQIDDTPIDNCELQNGIESLNRKGLCMNCDDNRVCGLQNSGSNVIHCEEYSLAGSDERNVHKCSDEFITRPSFRIKDLV